MVRNNFDENSDEESAWTFEEMMSHIVDTYATIKALFSQYFSMAAFFVSGFIFVFIVCVCGGAMCKSCCCTSVVNCGAVCCLCLNLFLIPPKWFFRYFKFIDEEKKPIDVEPRNYVNIVTKQPLQDYYKNPTTNYYVEK